MRKVLTITLASVVAVLAAQTSSHAAPPFDGLWATSRKDCRNKDGPDSKTFIDLDNIKGKPAPLVDQYENHCRVDRKTPAGDGLVLTTTCFDDWGSVSAFPVPIPTGKATDVHICSTA